MFDYKKPTAQLLGRWQPWHDGHTALFKKAFEDVAQVCIMVRDVGGIIGIDAGSGRTNGQFDNPFDWNKVRQNIVAELEKNGFTEGKEYVIIQVPNIVDVAYGRDVGYTITQYDLGAEIHDISASKIRREMRLKGEL